MYFIMDFFFFYMTSKGNASAGDILNNIFLNGSYIKRNNFIEFEGFGQTV